MGPTPISCGGATLTWGTNSVADADKIDAIPKKKEIYYTHRKETGKISSPLWQLLVNGIYLCGFERFLFGCKRARARPHARSARRLYFCTCARFHQLGAVSILCDDDAAIRATVIENGGFVGGGGVW